MKSIDVCLVGHDVQPSMAFGMLTQELATRGLRVLISAMQGKDREMLTEQAIKLSRLVVVGMSSSAEWARAETEAATMAVKEGIPVGIYADIFRSYRRAWFKPFRQDASLLFVLNEAEIPDARQMYPRALIVPSGNPTHESYFTFAMSRKKVEEIVGCGPGSFVALVSGSKHASITADLLKAAAYGIARIPQARLVLSVHPGDPNPLDQYRAVSANLGVQVFFATKGVLRGSDVLSRADVLIESSGSLGIEAACKRVPAINYLTPEAYDLIEREIGEREWPTCAHGTSHKVDADPEALRSILESPDKLSSLRSRQEELYPEPKPGTKPRAVSMMANAVEEILAKAG